MLTVSRVARGVLAIACVLPGTAAAIDIEGTCYPHPIRLGVNDQGREDAAQIVAANIVGCG